MNRPALHKRHGQFVDRIEGLPSPPKSIGVRGWLPRLNLPEDGSVSPALEFIPPPLAGREGRVQGTRELAVARTPYVIAYRIREDEIQILAVLHGGQRWPTTFSG
ncbi:MAG: type II toxin-antitoxin system RelE/ParE family toxin [Terriglobia bacterium]